MKTIILFLFTSFLQAQNPCGEWAVDQIYEEIHSTDTIKYIPDGDTSWIYSDWERGIHKSQTYLMYCPCGCGPSTLEYAYRVNGKGINQEVHRITSYKYIEPKLTEYQKKIKQLKNQ